MVVHVLENAETGEKVEIRQRRRMSKFDARTEIFRALTCCMREIARGEPDRWLQVLELLREGHTVPKIFPAGAGYEALSCYD